MTTEVLLRLLTLGFLAVLLSLRLTQLHHTDAVGDQSPGTPRYGPFAIHLLLPLLLAVVLALEALTGRLTKTGLLELLGLQVQILCSASVYCVLLLPLLPWLRRHISARACGFLWMMPAFLYVAYYSYGRPAAPRFILRLREGWAGPLALVWGLGALAVLVGAVGSHLRFRRQLLRDAHPVTDPDLLTLWTTEQQQAGRKHPCPLLISPALTTPLSIGLFRRTVRVVLPREDLDRRDLQLILRHELIHLCRLDPWNKLFLTVCTALFWWNPLMWLARRRCSEDLELTDRSVTLREDHAPYAARTFFLSSPPDPDLLAPYLA